ncbi:hypothetical protein JM18_001109 [Phytophthora kernoviae]|uniref:Cas12f1-like TNB domain-containing protein n=1 Tax=Phytophthora kernoviae TaxID=325452 RepID=A0A921VF12_9STRA|nr:hypothetical protein JM18_001109 [Phytophthora kernoviae]
MMLSVKDAYTVLKRRFKATNAMEFKLALLENKSKTKGRTKGKQLRKRHRHSHFKFKTLVKYKMDCIGGRMIECEEEYTSKTCSSCGGIKDNFGGSSTYKYSFCHVVYDRDVNAAKSIFHKNVHVLVKK